MRRKTRGNLKKQRKQYTRRGGGKNTHSQQHTNIKQKETIAQNYEGKAILVTGGAGFIGSHIVDALLENGARLVRVLDNMDTDSHGVSANRESPVNLRNAAATGRLEFVFGDIRDKATCEECCKGMNIVFHEAAMVSVPKSMSDPLKNHDTNITGTLNMLVAAAKAGVQRFVYASSAATYGTDPELPKRETMIRNYPSPYALSKGVDEDYAKLWSQAIELGRGMTCIGLRYFNVYGPRQNPTSFYSGVISIFANKLKNNLPITIYGDGLQTRDFVFVKDIVHANLLAGAHTLKVGESRVFNVGTGKSVTLLELLNTMKKIWGKPDIRPTMNAPRQGDIRNSKSNITKISEELGYIPNYTLEQGLQALYESL